jgi:L-2-hydroxyglutarate oxidase
VPSAGIVDFRQVALRLVDELQINRRARLLVGAQVHAVESRGNLIEVETQSGRVRTHFVVNCAGLQADRIARLCGQKLRERIVPFRGDYFLLQDGAQKLVRNLIYPVPDPMFPFLGVHATRTITGHVECGPNASLALGREAYGKFEVHPGDLSDALSYPGLWRLLSKNPRAAFRELKQSFSKQAFLDALRTLLPEVQPGQLAPREAGIRAQALAPDGTLIDDFLLKETPQVLSVCNAPSPAATSSFAIAETIGNRVLARLE